MQTEPAAYSCFIDLYNVYMKVHMNNTSHTDNGHIIFYRSPIFTILEKWLHDYMPSM